MSGTRRGLTDLWTCLLKTAQAGNGLLLSLVASLSIISRNSRKLLRVLDFLLAYCGLRDLQGISGSHGKTIESYIRLIF